MTDRNITNDLKLYIKDVAAFDIDNDDELCIDIWKDYQNVRTWLSREEGAMLLELLKRWLS